MRRYVFTTSDNVQFTNCEWRDRKRYQDVYRPLWVYDGHGHGRTGFGIAVLAR
jgi:hypothetical protein